MKSEMKILVKTEKCPDNGRFYIVKGTKRVDFHQNDGFVYEKFAQQIVDQINAFGVLPKPLSKTPIFPKPDPFPYPVPAPQPAPDYSAMGQSGPLCNQRPTRFTLGDPLPNPNSIKYETPQEMILDRSKGSIPVQTCPNDEIDLTPAQTTSIQLVRLIEARRIYEQTAAHRKVDVNLEPEAAGHYAAVMGHQRKSCPYTQKHQPSERKLWLESFDATY